MPKPLRVWTTVHANIDHEALDAVGVPTGRSQACAVVAAATRAEAARRLGMTSSRLRDWGGETGNAEQIEVASADPGQVFITHPNRVTTWVQVELAPRSTRLVLR